MEDVKHPELRSEISFLGAILGDTIRDFSGEEALSLVEELRRLAWDRRVGPRNADQRMTERIAGLDYEQIRIVTRAFSVFLDLLNVIEDRRRIRVLGQRARSVHPGPRRESIRSAIWELKNGGRSAEVVQSLVDRLHIELVFTAHPTEAKRRSVRRKLTAIRGLMARLDGDPLPEERDRTEREIRGEIARLWQTDFIRPWRPSVMQEAARGLSIKPVLWKEIPRIAEDLRSAVRENYGEEVKPGRCCVTFGSWIGGDRDGHPGVTADITTETFLWLRQEAITFHLKTCDALFESLSLSQRQTQTYETLKKALSQAESRYPHLSDRLAPIPPDELCRQWLSVIRWRLEQTERLTMDDATDAGGRYDSARELSGDVAILSSALRTIPGGERLIDDTQAWQSQIETFGFHLARLDVRQNAKVYADVIDALLCQSGVCADAASLDEAARIKLLEETLESGLSITEGELSPMVRETLAMFRVLHRVAGRFSPAAIGAHVISMTAAASDVLTVLWLWKHTANGGDQDSWATGQPIVPLLETIDDLEQGPAILSGMLEIPAYREYLRRQGDHQIVMLGYSDSTKDGGYLPACWSLYRGQQRLVEVAATHGVDLTFFHGRGGSLGRGGGPAARSILSLPHGTFHGSLRLTEQGEVLADRYDDPAIAHRHLEQVVWSSLLAAGNPGESPPDRWLAIMDKISGIAFRHYRQLLEQPDFVEFFRRVTPLSEIERLPIGSRPARRKSGGGLTDLRAIPWVFSWTQSRCLLPAWYGIGAAMSSMIDDDGQKETLRSMYSDWSFFRAMIDNAELALAKSDLAIAAHYANLSDGPSHRHIAEMIAAEHEEACRVVLDLTDQAELLDGTPWLKESIRVRNRFIDPINLIQVELLRRARDADMSNHDSTELRHLTRLSINGIAAGMRTSG